MAPAFDEIEISLFGGGAGVGECIVAHVGAKQWIVVDSFTARTGQPVAQDYLQSIGVNLAEDVKFIIASHWHDDHIQGISRLFAKAATAKFVISSALKADEFGTLIQIDQQINSRKRTIGELNQILATKIKESRGLVEAISDRTLWTHTFEGNQCTIYSLSPSDASVQLARQEIASLVQGFDSANRKIPDINPNHNSVVIRITVGDKHILLGSDLEITGGADTGWSAVLSSIYKPDRNASVFKVPHHGSETSYAPDIWEELLISSPFAIVTPFKKGKKRLPQKEYADKILNHADSAFITSDPNARAKPKKRDHKVEKTIRQLGFNPVELSYPEGHIRLRSKLNEQGWRVELFGSAIHLNACNWQV